MLIASLSQQQEEACPLLPLDKRGQSTITLLMSTFWLRSPTRPSSAPVRDWKIHRPAGYNRGEDYRRWNNENMLVWGQLNDPNIKVHVWERSRYWWARKNLWFRINILFYFFHFYGLWPEVKVYSYKVLMMDLFLKNMQLFTWQDVEWWSRDVWTACGSVFFLSVWTLILTAPIHCRWSTVVSKWCNSTFFQIQLRNKLIYILDEGKLKQILIFGRTITLK